MGKDSTLIWIALGVGALYLLSRGSLADMFSGLQGMNQGPRQPVVTYSCYTLSNGVGCCTNNQTGETRCARPRTANDWWL